MRNLSYELCSTSALTRLMSYALPLLDHVATVASPFRFSVFHFLAKLSKILQIFFSCENKTMTLSLLHKKCLHTSHIKGII